MSDQKRYSSESTNWRKDSVHSNLTAMDPPSWNTSWRTDSTRSSRNVEETQRESSNWRKDSILLFRNVDDRLGGSCESWRESRNSRPSTKFLQDLEREDSWNVLQALSSDSGVLEMYEQSKIGDNQLEVMISILNKACRAKQLHHCLNKLLLSISESSFLNGPVVQYITSLTTKHAELPVDVLMKLTDTLMVLMGHIPSHSSESVICILSLLSHFVKKNESEIGMNPLVESVTAAEEMMKDITRQIHGGDIVRGQDVEDTFDDEPPNDFRKINPMPTSEEIQCEEPPFIRKNIVFGTYKSVDHYLDVQYRLLREDFVCPLREGLKMLLLCKASNKTFKNVTSDVRYYGKVYIQNVYCTSSRGMMYKIWFDVGKFGKKMKWESTKRLIYGSLVGLSKDNFKNIIFGTVIDRKPEDLENGLVDLLFEGENAERLDLNPYTEYQMIENSAYYEAYRHVLQGLQEINKDSLPFSGYILNTNSCTDVEAPAYLRDLDIRYNFKCLLSTLTGLPDEFHNVPVLDLNAWPSAEDLGMNRSQYAAIQTAMTKEIVTIQGPPGTGKTYIGLKIVQLLLENKFCWNSRVGQPSQILIVCYTNHALDQFLEGIIKFRKLEVGGLVRVGGRISPGSILSQFTIREIKKRVHLDDPYEYRYDGIHDDGWILRDGLANELEYLKKEITQLSALIKGTGKWLVHEQYLRSFMTPYQMRSLFNRKSRKGNSVLSDWLKLRYSKSDDVIQRHDAVNDANYIIENDPDEIARIQDDRMIDDNDISLERDQHLKEIEDLGVECVEFVRFHQNSEMNFTLSRAGNREVVKNLRCHDMMTVTQANNVENVWDLTIDDRWRLYKLWVSEFCEERSSELGNIVTEYNLVFNRVERMHKEEDFQVLRRASVIGMTTTGAAKIRDLLHRLQPRIVIVEEAAEVLEAHIVTSLSKGCEHLIMIGDHQQLRPSPAVYKLAKTYHMDISLFERMVKNNLRCNRLTLQHRMRPEIAGLIVPSIYKDLENHESVHSYENIKGVQGNVFFIKHSYPEETIQDSKSRFNRHEALYVAALTKYFLQQGYRPTQITVLTTYVAQVTQLRWEMSKAILQGVRLTTVDNYQGEENDIIILSLVRSNPESNIGFLKTSNRVCVALSRARMGLFIIGNMDNLSEASLLWQKIASYLENGSRLVEALPLACQNHPDTVIHAANQIDFEQAPEGGCVEYCGTQLACGHICEYKCHPVDQKHINEYKCSEPCSRTPCVLRHRCPKKMSRAMFRLQSSCRKNH